MITHNAAKRLKVSTKLETIETKTSASASASSGVDASGKLGKSGFATVPTAVVCLMGMFLDVRDHCSFGATSLRMKMITRLPDASTERIRIPRESSKSKLPTETIQSLLQFYPRKLHISVSRAKEYQQFLLRNHRLRELFLEADSIKDAELVQQNAEVFSWMNGLTQVTKLHSFFESAAYCPSSLTELELYSFLFGRNSKRPDDLFNMRHLTALQTLKLPYDQYHLDLSQIGLVLPALRHLEYGFVCDKNDKNALAGWIDLDLRARSRYELKQGIAATIEPVESTNSKNSLIDSLSLSGFGSCTNLEHLSIYYSQSTMTYDWNSLPCSLESLEIFLRSDSVSMPLSPLLMKELAEGIRRLTQLKRLKISGVNFFHESIKSATTVFTNTLARAPVTLKKLEELYFRGNLELGDATDLSNFGDTLTTLELVNFLDPLHLPQLPHLCALYLPDLRYWQKFASVEFFAKQLRHVVTRYNSLSFENAQELFEIFSNREKMGNLVSVGVHSDIYFSKHNSLVDPRVNDVVTKFKVEHPEISVWNCSEL